MKIDITIKEKKTPTLNDVAFGDLFIDMDSGDVYLRTNDTLSGVMCKDGPHFKVYSLRTGTSDYFNANTPVRLVHKITLEADDYPKRG